MMTTKVTITLLTIAISEMATLGYSARAGERPGEDLERAKQIAALVQAPIQSGPIAPTSASIKSVPCPEWFRDAKFGIWSHWGPNCFSGVEQNYAKEMYRHDSPAYRYHVERFGDPAKVGFKDVLKYFDAAKWDPDALMKKYKAAGARYFVSLARYHDNFDMYDSSLTPWNSVNYGPKKDIAGLWRQAALNEGLHFGLSFHPNPTFFWEGQAQNRTKADYDTADPRYWSLYDPPPGTPGFEEEFADNVYARTKEAIDKYQPDVLYFDGGIPDGPKRGLRLISHFYNSSIARHGGTNAAVLTVKSDDGGVLDLERSHAPKLVARQWQCDTAEAGWFWLSDDVINQSGDRHIKHKSSTTMLHALADIVSKNGNLLLNIALKADGTLDPYGETLLADFAAWMVINGEAIFETRPFVVYGEGPSRLPGNGANELKQPMTAKDIRFTTKGDTLYAIMCGWPADRQAIIATLADGSPVVTGSISDLQLLGHAGKLPWKRTKEGLIITLPEQQPCQHACVFKISGLKGDTEAIALPHPGSIVRPDKDNVLTLMPEHAEIHDPGNRLYVGFSENETVIALWDDSRAYMTYNKVQLEKAGQYEVIVRMAAVKPTSVQVEMAGQQLTRAGAITSDWESFVDVSFGTVDIKAPGVLPITIRPAPGKEWNRINLATIELRPVR